MNKINNVSQLSKLRPYKQIISRNVTAWCSLFTIPIWWHTTCEAPSKLQLKEVLYTTSYIKSLNDLTLSSGAQVTTLS